MLCRSISTPFTEFMRSILCTRFLLHMQTNPSLQSSVFMQEALGGNSKTCLICTVSPSASNEAETLSTLRFGQRAKFIRNRAAASVVSASSTTHREQCVSVARREPSLIFDGKGRRSVYPFNKIAPTSSCAYIFLPSVNRHNPLHAFLPFRPFHQTLLKFCWPRQRPKSICSIDTSCY